MEYRKVDHNYLIRMDSGEEIITQLYELVEKEHIRLASVSALGAINDFTVGVFHVDTKAYTSNRFQGEFEIVSLTGTITEMDGKPYLHLHMSAGDEKGHVFGGHLNRAVISATCEMVLHEMDGVVERQYNEAIGLNLFSF